MFTWIFKPQSPNSLNFCEFECSAYIQNCEPASSFVCADFSGCFSVLCLITYTGGSCISNTCTGDITYYGCSGSLSIFHGNISECMRLRCENHECNLHGCGNLPTTYYCYGVAFGCDTFYGECTGTRCVLYG